MSVKLLPEYSTKIFNDFYESVNDFIYDYQNIGIPVTIDVTTSATTLYYLLYSRYGNSPIANEDVNQFKYKLFSVIWQFGPTWEKKLDIQKKLRNISDTDLLQGGKAIYNHAFNPETAPSTSDLTEINFINDQNTTNYKKSAMDAYMQLWNLLDNDVTEEFLRRFRICFKQFVADEKPLLYVTEVEDEE